jgi:hypothetical protein
VVVKINQHVCVNVNKKYVNVNNVNVDVRKLVNNVKHANANAVNHVNFVIIKINNYQKYKAIYLYNQK